ncbi:MAG: hypothetical protein AAGJ57_01465 [Pseudomonadota bacterium]
MSDTFEFNNIPYSDLPGDWSTALKLSWIEQGDAVVTASKTADDASKKVVTEKERNDIQDQSITELEKEVTSFGQSIQTLGQATSSNQKAINDHVVKTDAHGSNGKILGANDYAEELVGGVVLLAAKVDELTAATITVVDAPAAYDQAQIQGLVDAVRSLATKQGDIINKVNEIIQGQITAKQMSGV